MIFRFYLIHLKNSSICHQDLWIVAIVEIASFILLVRNIRRFLVFYVQREVGAFISQKQTVIEGIADISEPHKACLSACGVSHAPKPVPDGVRVGDIIALHQL